MKQSFIRLAAAPGQKAVREFEADQSNMLETLQRAVGGLIEPIRPFELFVRGHGKVTFDAYVNEEGLINGMPENLLGMATGIGRFHGPIVLSGGVDSEGEIIGISPEVMQSLRTAFGTDMHDGLDGIEDEYKTKEGVFFER